MPKNVPQKSIPEESHRNYVIDTELARDRDGLAAERNFSFP
jgi:hypothetical protein